MINLLQQFYSRGSSPPPPVSPPINTGLGFRQFNPCDPCCGVSDPLSFCDITPPDDLVLINGDGKHILAYQGLDESGLHYWQGLVTFNNAIGFTYKKNQVAGTRYTYDASTGVPSVCSSYDYIQFTGTASLINTITVFDDNIDYTAIQTNNKVKCLTDNGTPCAAQGSNYTMCLKHTVNFVPISIAPVYVRITKTAIGGYEQKIKCQYDSDYDYIKTPFNDYDRTTYLPTIEIKTFKKAEEVCFPIYMDSQKLYTFEEDYRSPAKATYFLNQNIGTLSLPLITSIFGLYYTTRSASPTLLLDNFVYPPAIDFYNVDSVFKFNQEISDNCFWSRSFPVFTQAMDGIHYTYLGWSDDTLGNSIFAFDPHLFFNYTGSPFSYTIQHPQFHIDNTLEESESLFLYLNRQKHSQQSNIWANGFFRVILPNNNKRTINPIQFINTRTRLLARNFNCQILGFNFELNCVQITPRSFITNQPVAVYMGQPDKNHFGALIIDSGNGDYNFYFVELIDGASEYVKAKALFSRLLDKELYTSLYSVGEECNILSGSCFNYSDYESTTCDPNKSNDFKEHIINWDRKIYKKSGNLKIDGVLNIDPLVLGFNAENHYKTIYGDVDHTTDSAYLADCGVVTIGNVFVMPYILTYYDHYDTSHVTEIYESESVIITELN